MGKDRGSSDHFWGLYSDRYSDPFLMIFAAPGDLVNRVIVGLVGDTTWLIGSRLRPPTQD